MKNKSILTALVATSAFALNLAANAGAIPYPNVFTPLTVGQTLFSTGGDVTVSLYGTSTSIDLDYLFLTGPVLSNPNYPILNNAQAAGTTVNLGTIAAGTLLQFGLFNSVSGNIYYTGAGSLNADGFVHAYVVGNYNGNPNQTFIGFEDLNGVTGDYNGIPNNGADWNYNDLDIVVTGASTSVPDSGSTLMLLGGALTGLGLLKRKFLA